MLRATGWGVALALAPAAAAFAQGPIGTEPAEPEPAEPKLLPAAQGPSPVPEPVEDTSHKGQFQVSARIGLGLRAVVAYDDADYCGDSDNSTSTGNAPVCTGRAPFSMDLELGYGIARRIDLLLELRLGIETDFGATSLGNDVGPRQFHLSPGARFFFSDGKTSKLFTTAQLVFDFAGYKDAGGMDRGADFGVRNLNGLWFDLDRAYGFYAYIGETATFGRWMRFELEAGVGLQGRYR